MRTLSAEELAFVEELIADTEAAAADVGLVLGAEEPAVTGMLAARDYLRAVRDSRQIVGGALSPEGREIIRHARGTGPRPGGCPDGGACHHLCGGGRCFRVECASPLSAAGWGDTWPDEVKAAEAAKPSMGVL